MVRKIVYFSFFQKSHQSVPCVVGLVEKLGKEGLRIFFVEEEVLFYVIDNKILEGECGYKGGGG